jgi:DNA-binding XRE family transcriptional regulator
MSKRRFKSNAAAYLYKRYFAGDPAREQLFQEETANAEIARTIYRLRNQAGLTQQELADRIGATEKAISRLEDADYEGNSLAMLKRVTEALDPGVQERFIRAKGRNPA